MAVNKLRTQFYQGVETNTQKAAFNAKEVCSSRFLLRFLYSCFTLVMFVRWPILRRSSLVSATILLEKQFLVTSTIVILLPLESVSAMFLNICEHFTLGRTEAFPNYALTRYRMSWWRL